MLSRYCAVNGDTQISFYEAKQPKRSAMSKEHQSNYSKFIALQACVTTYQAIL